MKLLEAATEIDLTDIDISNINENINNAEAIFEAVKNKIVDFVAEAGINIVFALILLIIGWKTVNVLSAKMKEGKIRTYNKVISQKLFNNFS